MKLKCSDSRDEENIYQILADDRKRGRLDIRSKNRREYDIKVNLKTVEGECVVWIHLDQGGT
jgi:hypothetical protein